MRVPKHIEDKLNKIYKNQRKSDLLVQEVFDWLKKNNIDTIVNDNSYEDMFTECSTFRYTETFAWVSKIIQIIQNYKGDEK